MRGQQRTRRGDPPRKRARQTSDQDADGRASRASRAPLGRRPRPAARRRPSPRATGCRADDRRRPRPAPRCRSRSTRDSPHARAASPPTPAGRKLPTNELTRKIDAARRRADRDAAGAEQQDPPQNHHRAIDRHERQHGDEIPSIDGDHRARRGRHVDVSSRGRRGSPP